VTPAQYAGEYITYDCSLIIHCFRHATPGGLQWRKSADRQT